MSKRLSSVIRVPRQERVSVQLAEYGNAFGNRKLRLVLKSFVLVVSLGINCEIGVDALVSTCHCIFFRYGDAILLTLPRCVVLVRPASVIELVHERDDGD